MSVKLNKNFAIEFTLDEIHYLVLGLRNAAIFCSNGYSPYDEKTALELYKNYDKLADNIEKITEPLSKRFEKYQKLLEKRKNKKLARLFK